MAERNATLTVQYVNGVVSVVGSGDVDIYRGETERITFQPGNGVSKVSSFTNDTPSSRVSVSFTTDGNDLVVTDVDNLLATDPQDDVNYRVQIMDDSTPPRAHWSDPQLINHPTQRGN